MIAFLREKTYPTVHSQDPSLGEEKLSVVDAAGKEDAEDTGKLSAL